MSSIRTRTRSDGSEYEQVLWRDHGTQRSRAFNGVGAAERYKRILDAAGEDAAEMDLAKPAKARTEWTVDAWVLHHIAHRARITEGTRKEYRKMWARTFGPLIGPLPLDILTRDMVSMAVLTLSKQLAYKSIKNARDLLSTCLADAVEQGVIPTRATKGVGIPRVHADAADDMRILTMDEYARVEAEIDDYWVAIFRVLVGTGMRVNEATALRVSSVDLAASSLRITRGYKRAEKGWEIGPPKTPTSVRTVELDPVFRQILEPYVTGRPADALLFTSRKGNRVHDGNLRSRVWQPACVRAGVVPPTTVHALRHSHASWLIAAGEDMGVVQARLGHKSITTTMDVYNHLTPDTRKRAATVAARAFSDRVPQISAR